jgi:Uma2 family endonuclease
VPETQLHLDLRTLLYHLLLDYLGEASTVGSEQFVYWDAGDPKRCIAPDVYVKCVPRGEPIRSWKVWERGAPDVAVEIISDSDSKPAEWRTKFARYQALGVRELIRLDLLTPNVPRLRVWNRVDEALREREFEADTVDSLVLQLTWTVAPAQAMQHALRIAYPSQPLTLVPTSREARKTESEARKAAEARVAELEALLDQPR